MQPTQANVSSAQKIFRWIQILSSIGVLLAIYLLWEQLSHSPFRPCDINSVVNCDAIISGAVSKTLGIPTPLFGLTGYIIIFLAATFQWKRIVMAMSTFGLAFCLWIGSIELFQLHVVCPVCITCQLVIIAVFILAILLLRVPAHDAGAGDAQSI
jgi:uncharacterized membrane protein